MWDTYRAAHPLYTLLVPERAGDMVESMIAHKEAKGFLPIWTLWGKENYCMIGHFYGIIDGISYYTKKDSAMQNPFKYYLMKAM